MAKTRNEWPVLKLLIIYFVETYTTLLYLLSAAATAIRRRRQ